MQQNSTNYAVSSLNLLYSLLVAIGIEAFNKFSQEQKAETEEEEGTGDDISGGDKKSKTNFFSAMSAKNYINKLASWTKAAISSTRV